MQKDYYRISNENKTSEVAWLIRDAVTARTSIKRKSRKIVKALGEAAGDPGLKLGSNRFADLGQSS